MLSLTKRALEEFRRGDQFGQMGRFSATSSSSGLLAGRSDSKVSDDVQLPIKECGKKLYPLGTVLLIKDRFPSIAGNHVTSLQMFIISVTFEHPVTCPEFLPYCHTERIIHNPAQAGRCPKYGKLWVFVTYLNHCGYTNYVLLNTLMSTIFGRTKLLQFV
jgi:hypothetical protein